MKTTDVLQKQDTTSLSTLFSTACHPVKDLLRAGYLFLALGLSTAALSIGAELTLDECIHTALKANPDMEAALHRIAAAEAAVTGARSGYYPQVTLSSTWARTDNPPQAFFMSLNQRVASLQKDFNNPPDTENLRHSVSARLLLLDAGLRKLGIDTALTATQSARAMQEAVANGLIHAVTAAYYRAIEAGAMVGVMEETERSVAESLRVAGERVKAGGAMRTDVLNLEVRLAQTSEELIRARNGLGLALAALDTAVGADITANATFPATGAAALPEVKIIDPETAAGNRPELAAMELGIKMGKNALSMSQRSHLPRLSAFASSDWDSGKFTSAYEQSYMGGVMLEWDIFDGFRKGSEKAKATQELETSLAETRKLKNNLKLEIRQAELLLNDARQREKVCEQGLKSAAEALRITRERYAQNAASNTELLATQAAHTAMKVSATAARYELLIALSNYNRATGTLVTRNTIEK